MGVEGGIVQETIDRNEFVRGRAIQHPFPVEVRLQGLFLRARQELYSTVQQI